MPGRKRPGGARLTVTDAQVAWLEGEIDRLNAELGAAEVLHSARRQPGLGLSASRPHGLPARRTDHGRTQGRPGEGVSEPSLKYVNRLSDYFSSPAAMPTTKAPLDVLWAPGQNR